MLFLPTYIILASQSNPVFERKYTNTINGTKIGQSDILIFADGHTVNTANIDVATTKLRETLEDTRSNGAVTSYTFTAVQPTGTSIFKWDGKNLNISQGGKKDKFPFAAADMPPLWMSNYMGGTLDSLANETFTEGQKEKSVKIFLVEGQTVLTVKLTPLDSHSYKENGKERVATGIGLEVQGLKTSLYFDSNQHVVGFFVPSQSYSVLEDGVTGLQEDPIAKYPELSQIKYKTKIIHDLVCTTRDGTKLVADAMVPDAPGRFPVIMERTPYGRGASLLDGGFYAPRGYAVVVQDARGTGDSGGTFDPFMSEEKDGYDAVEWAAKLPFSNGKVGMIGGSYLGAVQWQAAVMDPPHLKCIVPQVSPPDAMHNLPYEYGTFMLYPSLWWGNIVKSKNADLSLETSRPKNPKGLTALPLSKVPEATLGAKIPFFTKWLERDGLDKWKGFDFEHYLLRAKVPALQISGWWDGDGIGTDLHWLKMRAAGRKNQWLVEGPWVHSFDRSTKVDDQDYGPQSIIDLNPLYLRFFDHYLKGMSDGWLKETKVRYFVMGENKWHFAKDYPDPAARPAKLYLAPNGRLSKTLERAQFKYRYDPSKDTNVGVAERNPMDTTGGLHTKAPKPGLGLTFKSQPFTKNTTIEGPYGVDLWVKINRPSANLFAAPVKIFPNGTIEIITQPGKFNLSYLKGLDKPRNLIPGKLYKVHLFPWISAIQFKKGERLGLLIVSSAFPMMARNLNTGQPLLTGKKMVPVNVTIVQDKRHPSVIEYYQLP